MCTSDVRALSEFWVDCNGCVNVGPTTSRDTASATGRARMGNVRLPKPRLGG